MKNAFNIGNTWLNLNYQCNLRCEWCYASGTQFAATDDMSFDDAAKAIELTAKLGIKNVTLIGGEPTCYEQLPQIIGLCKKNGLNVTMATNGIKLSDSSYLNELKLAGLDSIGLSLKSTNKEGYIKSTKADAFDKVLDAIRNLVSLDMNFSVQMVLTADNINSFIDGVTAAKNAGAKNFSFSFCYDFSQMTTSAQSTPYDFKKNMFDIIDSFVSQYDKLCKVTEDKFTLAQTFPLCV